MSYDSLFAWKESIFGVETAVWPPMQAYFSYLSRVTAGGPAGIFFGQVFVLFFSVYAVLSFYIRGLRAELVSFFSFFLLMLYFPTLIGVMGVVWKDVTTTSLALLGLAFWLAAVHYRSWVWFTAAVMAISLGVATRYNAIPLFVPLMALMTASPFGSPSTAGERLKVVCILALGLATAYASTTWRLPDLQQLPSSRGFAGVQEFDLIGITACSNKSYIPLGMTSGEPITPAQARFLYDPRHVQIAFRAVPGLPQIKETDANGDVARMWRRSLQEQFGCYLSHRTAVFVEQMGIAKAHVFYPTHGGIDENSYGMKLAHPDLARRFNEFVGSGADQLWRRPALLYLLAILTVAVLLTSGGPGGAVMLALLAGALIYPATLFLVGPAADARYIFPSNIFCALILTLAVPLAFVALKGRGGTSAPPAT